MTSPTHNQSLSDRVHNYNPATMPNGYYFAATLDDSLRNGFTVYFISSPTLSHPSKLVEAAGFTILVCFDTEAEMNDKILQLKIEFPDLRLIDLNKIAHLANRLL